MLKKIWKLLKYYMKYERGLMLQSLYHLEQASEKTLKAYLIGIWFYPMKIVVDTAENIGTAGEFRDIHHRLKSAIYNYIVPRNLGHDFSRFLNRFLPWLYKAYCSERLVEYVNATLKAWLQRVIINKERVIAKLMEQGTTREIAEKVYSLLVYIFSQPAPITIGGDIRRKSCDKARLDFGTSLEGLKREDRPCLQATTLFIDYVMKLAEEAYNQAILEYREVLDQKIRKEVLEPLGLSDIFPKNFTNSLIKDLLKSLIVGNIVIVMTLPLHFCLFKYYNATRYGEGTVPKEEFENIPNVIDTLRHIHRITITLISRSRQD
ncbi:MAG: hypothetical protein QXJ03_02950 [Desulfurococcus sp.]|uniref:hypothetical protein n=1 Tax=Desulfurococcus sp. TaxID=51678 RepID=UPI003167E016